MSRELSPELEQMRAAFIGMFAPYDSVRVMAGPPSPEHPQGYKEVRRHDPGFVHGLDILLETAAFEQARGIAELVPEGQLHALTLEALQREVRACRTKFPGNRFMLAALTEEVGELARALLQRAPREKVINEAIQVATIALRIAEEGDVIFDSITDAEAKP